MNRTPHTNDTPHTHHPASVSASSSASGGTSVPGGFAPGRGGASDGGPALDVKVPSASGVSSGPESLRRFDRTDRVIRLAQMGMLAAISVLLVMVLHFPLIPAVSMMEYDMADVPVLLGTILYGTGPGLLILLVTATVQAFLLGGNGWIGLLMHVLASGAMVILVGEVARRRPRFAWLAGGLAGGTLLMTAIMVPLDLWILPSFMGVPLPVVQGLVVPAIIPFNLLKGGINSLLTGILLRALLPFLRKNAGMLRLRRLPGRPKADACGNPSEK